MPAMKKLVLSCASILVATGCASRATYVHSDTTTLGRVVIYRNGVAYFERTADIDDDTLRLSVPRDKVDDFLKSLTVVDAKTGEPAPVAYPSDLPESATGLVDMKIALTGPRPHKLRLTYVTEAPAWKPSYRVVVGKDGKVGLEGWAIVDNNSGEDWKSVRLGVGSSSALSFRFDLQSLRVVERETLHANDLFAQAPPLGGSTYGQDDGRSPAKRLVGDLPDTALASIDGAPDDSASSATAAPGNERKPEKSGEQHRHAGPAARPPAAPAQALDLGGFVARAQAAQAGGGQLLIEGYANAEDTDKYQASLDRANRMRDHLVQNGIDPNRVVVVGRGAQAGRNGGVRVVAAADPARKKKEEEDDRNAQAQNAPNKSDSAGGKAGDQPPAQPSAPADPIGTSHFESTATMTVPRGTSAMVSILDAETEGEVVYLYDPESARGNADFPFKSVRIKNPTDSELESGPVTVFGEGRFIGEGLSDPIPARSVAFVPFALDRQIVVETKHAEKDEIARIMTVQRGVFSTEVKHTRKSTLTLHNRMAQKATLYVRHTVPAGYTLAKPLDGSEHIGSARLLRVELGPNETRDFDIEETTPVQKTTDIRSPEGLALVKAYVSSAAAEEAPLRKPIEELVRLEEDMANLEQHIATTREQMGEYRQRVDELHVQIVTLRAVRSAGPLMVSLEKKMQEMSDRVSKATIDVVGLEEKLMIARVHFQDGVAELTLEKSDAPTGVATTK
jgi:uncharacterized protein DUF4139